MTTPLYNLNGIQPKLGNGHCGLWFDKFFDQYNNDWSISDSGKKNFLDKFAKKCGDDQLLKNHCDRLISLVSSLKAECRVFKTTWHFVTGMGLQHPVENGLAWHPTLGVPYLAGSGVKGLLRAWIENWSDIKNKEEWFGKQNQTGQLIFFDAIPIEPVQLTVDIMTPHYGKWYEQGNSITNLNQSEKIPADWHDPIPVDFLTVKKDTKFLFIIAVREEKDHKQAEEAMKQLEQALQYIGAGAKTAAGYGFFEYDEKATKGYGDKIKELKEKPQEELFSPAEKQLKDAQKIAEEYLKDGEKNKSKGNPSLKKLQELLENAQQWEDKDNQQQFAKFIEDKCKQPIKDWWDKPIKQLVKNLK